ncbi:hypothetical protein [Gluconobacter roseus]|uniref:hypothetical protein n=1 Tax=Gluconobacter roseus TaxID=586239 RepID=UPI0024E0D658|nr:hypothetical protein [Gluconobacter roseus]
MIWTRQVPDEWKKELNGHEFSENTLSLTGSLNEILSQVKAPDFCQNYPEFMLEDVAQIAALVAAFAVSDRLTFHLGYEPDQAQITKPAKLKALCCYGESTAGWSSGSRYSGDVLSLLEPFGVAFIPFWNNDRAQIGPPSKSKNIFLTLSAL